MSTMVRKKCFARGGFRDVDFGSLRTVVPVGPRGQSLPARLSPVDDATPTEPSPGTRAVQLRVTRMSFVAVFAAAGARPSLGRRARSQGADPTPVADALASPPPALPSRRLALAGAALALVAPPARAIDAGPPEGDCPECVGVLNDLLNSCPDTSEACVSSQNDDEAHFIAPWAYPGDRSDAMRRLVAVAVGEEAGRVPGARVNTRQETAADPNIDVYGRDKREVNRWILDATGAFVMRQPLPQRPAVRGAPSRGGGGVGTGVVARLAGGAAERGDAAPRVVAVRVAAYDESLGYVRLVVGKTASPDGSHTGDGPSSGDDGSSGARDGSSAGDDVFDVELLFWDDDEVVNVRVAARDAPKTGRWSLSYVDGLKYTKNAARDLAEELRIALGWEVLPVISEFDPRFNNSKRLWFEKALDFGGFDASVMDSPRGANGANRR